MSTDTLLQSAAIVDRSSARSIYVVTAVLFVVVALVGFGTFSNRRPMPPPVVHLHAVLMVAWLALFLAQSALMGTGRRQMHQNLGVASFLLAPAMLVSMGFVTAWSFRDTVNAGYSDFAAKILLTQIQDFWLFAVFYVWAVCTRRTAPETHKRMMVLATFALMNAATGRMAWLPGNIQPNLSYDLAPLYPLFLLAPALIYDVMRRGRVHRAYLAGIGVYLAFAVVTRFLWNSPWWLQTAPALLSTTG